MVSFGAKNIRGNTEEAEGVLMTRRLSMKKENVAARRRRKMNRTDALKYSAVKVSTDFNANGGKVKGGGYTSSGLYLWPSIKFPTFRVVISNGESYSKHGYVQAQNSKKAIEMAKSNRSVRWV